MRLVRGALQLLQLAPSLPQGELRILAYLYLRAHLVRVRVRVRVWARVKAEW